MVLLNSDCVSVLLMSAAGIFCTKRPSTWSFIREISGENTIVKPALQRAGIWKQIDFPAPVGMIPITSSFRNKDAIGAS